MVSEGSLVHWPLNISIVGLGRSGAFSEWYGVAKMTRGHLRRAFAVGGYLPAYIDASQHCNNQDSQHLDCLLVEPTFPAGRVK